ncbi:hypothetical protein CcrC1_gp262c [Caulobacter phage C1]|nr:hypothetical protein CcrC1_gp262c [Caulobacter phage C1]UTU08491.1 hypothetical protein CcrC2_gp263c [Caulobacter phage C2]UTU09006.1 hypothetical protein CcrJ4_gp257c [Caulobacter phage J4]UTU10124.1 hypothetical protein CcrRB23_gp262c [Caulobacter phage RB23]WGN97159.1 hypothetical protein [Bertelyvirus sp.]
MPRTLQPGTTMTDRTDAPPSAPVKPTRHFAFVIEGTEYESGWGPRPDGFVLFEDEQSAEAWMARMKAEDAQWARENPGKTRDFVYYDKRGYKPIKAEVAEALDKAGALHKDRASEFLASGTC